MWVELASSGQAQPNPSFFPFILETAAKVRLKLGAADQPSLFCRIPKDARLDLEKEQMGKDKERRG